MPNINDSEHQAKLNYSRGQSKYKNISVTKKLKTDGTVVIKYRARNPKVNVYIGVFETELEAAQAVANVLKCPVESLLKDQT